MPPLGSPIPLVRLLRGREQLRLVGPSVMMFETKLIVRGAAVDGLCSRFSHRPAGTLAVRSDYRLATNNVWARAGDEECGLLS